MGIGNIVKRLNDVMWKDDGVAGDAQRLEQIVWILFLKVYDDKEKLWEFHDSNFKSILPEELRWRNWAVDKKDGSALTGEELLAFVNEKLFPGIEKLDINESTPISKAIVKYTFDDVNNYMKNGILLRQVINIIDEIKFTNSNEKHEFNEIYERFVNEYVEYKNKEINFIGRKAYIYSLRDGIEIEDKATFVKQGEYLKSITNYSSGFLPFNAKETELIIKINSKMTVRITDNSQVDENTIFED